MENKPTSLYKQALHWIVVGLLVFIPLYPKLPLFDIAFSWTYIRVEDVLVAVSYIVLIVCLLLRKVSIRNFLMKPIVLFWIIGLLSTIVALLTLGSQDNWAIFKPHLIVLNYLRRIEYLGVLFLAVAAFSDRKGIKRAVIALVIGMIGVIIYGFGQKYGGFCSYLTMNEEFAKGTCISLQPGTRLSSTFGGHYDLAGYLVFVLPIIAGMIFATRSLFLKILLGTVTLFGFFMLLLTSSRISFPALLIALGMIIVMNVKNKKYLFAGSVLVVILTLVFGRTTIVDRLGKTLRVNQVTVDNKTGRILEQPTTHKDWAGLPESDRAIVLPFLPETATPSAFIVTKRQKGIKEELSPSSESGVIRNTVEVPQASTKEQSDSDKKEIIEEVRVVKGDYSLRYALVFDISFTTRFDGEWPVAFAAFKSHPILGQGYSTVTSAVDSSYIRALAEVGVVGFISFFAILIIFLKRAYEYVGRAQDRLYKLYVAGVASGVTGLLVNALLIDIFEASKVAFVMWICIGIAVWIMERGEKLEG
ncbi:MAG: O-antigen ligase family protein [bacterium]|nr:O-antigen ligase family protein [bacterium]